MFLINGIKYKQSVFVSLQNTWKVFFVCFSFANTIWLQSSGFEKTSGNTAQKVWKNKARNGN